MIDLQLHTTCSDGSYSAAELVAAVQAAGLAAFSITDHDTVAAYDDPAVATLRGSAALVPGIELSCDMVHGTFDLLGYFLDVEHPRLRGTLAGLQAWRAQRGELMVEQMRQAGLPITLAEVRELAGAGQIGRPHLARVLVRNGAVDTVQEAFNRWLHDDSPFYVPKKELPPAEAIDLVHAAGGAAVLAHPYQTRLAGAELAQAVRGWRAAGLDGLEVYYSQHTPAMIAEYAALADELGLCVSAGSDFHGVTKPHIAIGGVAPGAPPDEVILDGLRAAAARWR
jgi:predicted metal-dependent phosphoesterase TrpH